MVVMQPCPLNRPHLLRPTCDGRDFARRWCHATWPVETVEGEEEPGLFLIARATVQRIAA